MFWKILFITDKGGDRESKRRPEGCGGGDILQQFAAKYRNYIENGCFRRRKSF